MTKDQWLQIRNQQEIPLTVFFAFYREQGGMVADLFEFNKLFQSLSVTRRIIFTQNGVEKQREISYETAVHKLHRYYDNKFGTGCAFQTTAGSRG